MVYNDQQIICLRRQVGIDQTVLDNNISYLRLCVNNLCSASGDIPHPKKNGKYILITNELLRMSKDVL